MRLLLSCVLVMWGSMSLAHEGCLSEDHPFMPENDLHLQDNISKNADIDETRFNEIIDSVVAVYNDVIASHGKTLNVERNWTDSTVNAYASQSGDVWNVAMFGGLARRDEVTADGFALVVCHELGHHLGGFAFYGDTDWASSEGQSDYFATQACAKEIWANDLDVNASFRATVDSHAKDLCDQAWETEAEQNLCYRSSMAGASLAHLLSALGRQEVPQFDTPDPTVVTRTKTNHPAGQCRMDTYFQGALCTKQFDISLIPGKNHENGQTSVDAEFIASQYSCMRALGYELGNRPKCWFAAVSKAELNTESVRVTEITGNNNGVWEPGEKMGLNVELTNFLGREISGAVLNIQSDSSAVVFENSSAAYPSISHGQGAYALSDIIVEASDSIQCGETISLDMSFSYDGKTDGFTREWQLGSYAVFYSQTNNPSLEILDNQETLDVMEVVESGVSSAVTIDVDITHTYIGDLSIVLVSPQGNEYEVVSRQGGSQDDLIASFDVAIEAEDINGSWTLKVKDHANNDQGKLNSWSLHTKNLVCEGM